MKRGPGGESPPAGKKDSTMTTPTQWLRLRDEYDIGGTAA